MKKNRLEKLEAIRGFAAVYVVLTHFVFELNFVPSIIKKVFFSFGQEAVISFFLLSGFVIYISVHRTKNLNFRSYFIKRFRRIYFPVIASLIVSLLIFYFNGELYQQFSWKELAGNLLMLQDYSVVKPGTWVNPFLGNLPLWSLSYEWWFYMMFFPVYQVLFKNPNRLYFILVFSMMSYISHMIFPNHVSLVFSYFIIWWAGLECAVIYTHIGRFTYRNMKPILFSLLLMSILTAIPVLITKDIQFGYYPFLVFRHFFVALLFVTVGLVWYQKKFVNFDKILGIFTILAPISYALYILHFPILVQWKLDSYIPNFLIVSLIKFALIIGLSYLIEIKLQSVVNHYLK